MRWMSQYIARVLKGIVGHRLEVWKTEFGQWRRAHDTAEMVHELEEKETEILRLKTEIVERDAELYLVGTEEHLRDSPGSLRFGHGEQTSGIDEALQELVAEMVGEQAEEIARDAYFKAFELGPVADELYAEMVGECTEGVDYLNSVDLHSTVGREVVDACDLAVGKILNAMVFQTLCGVMHEPARQDLVFFEDFATETWMHKLLAGAVLIETGKEVQRDWAACAHTLAVEDCAADGLLASLAEFGSVAPGDAKVLMAEKVAVELSLVAAEEVQDVHDARAELAKAEHHMQVSEASHDVDGYLEAAASYDRAQAQVQREEAEAAAAVEARETAEAAVATAKAEQLVEIEVEEAAEALQLAQLADERLEKALAAGDLQGITAAHGIAEAARLRADKEEL